MNKQIEKKRTILSYSIFLALSIIATVAFLVIAGLHWESGRNEAVLALGCAATVFVIGLFSFVQYRYGKRARNSLIKQQQENELLTETIASLKEEIEAANHANEAKSAFLNSMASQLRTPLSTILGMDDILLEKELEADAKECITNIYSAGKIAESLLGDLGDLSKIEKGQLFIEEDAYSTAEVIRDTYLLTKSAADAKSINLELEVDENLPSVLLGDQDRMKQIILNLLSNAVSYTPLGTIKYSINYEKLVDDKIAVCVKVCDTGIGIKQEDLQCAFGHFDEDVNPIDRTLEGLGLGLTVTNQILQQMGSYLEVESEYGQGSTFSFCLVQRVEDDTPVGDNNEILKADVNPHGEIIKSFVAPGAKILAVDDNKMNLAVINGLLKKTRMQIDCVSSGKECLEAVKKEKYHIILLDHMMPDMDGVTTLKMLRGMQDNLSIDAPVIVITASAAVGVREFYLRAGFKDYISKPIEVASLYQVLKKNLKEELIISQDSVEQHIASEVITIQEDIANEATPEDVRKALRTIRRSMTDFDIEAAHEALNLLMEKENIGEYEDSLVMLKNLMDQEAYEKVALLLEEMENDLG